jgi:site-specific DNA-methyltransferase (adenine-specific)
MTDSALACPTLVTGVPVAGGPTPDGPGSSGTVRGFEPAARFGSALLYHADCLAWLAAQPPDSLHACVTDPPYGLVEYSRVEQKKLRAGKGGVWRIPPGFDGHLRSPLPRFTTLTAAQLRDLEDFFGRWARELLRVLVPGAHVLVASNPLVSFIVATSVAGAGFERRGEIVRLVMTMRGGDRPKGAHEEFTDVSVMPRSQWEPWLLFRKPLDGRVQDNLRKWKTGGLRRPSAERPFGDVIRSAPTRARERELAQHPSLKPQAFLRQVVRAMLPLGEGTVLDPFAGAGSTLAAAEAVGYPSIGVELDPAYVQVAATGIPKLTALQVKTADTDRG